MTIKQAIVTGATGLIGTALVSHLTSIGVEVLSLGRREMKSSETLSLFGGTVDYISCLMKNIEGLPDLVGKTSFQIGSNCIFFHLAWGTDTGLTSGSLGEQMENATASALAVKVAKSLGCSKFIASGSLEETFIEEFLSSGLNEKLSMQSNYALAKIASRDMCKMTAYLEKIDYVHTRLSSPLSPSLTQKSYIAGTLRAILQGEGYAPPKNKKHFDIISTQDVALAYELIGRHGKNKADYFIGTGQLIELNDYFEGFRQKIEGKELDFKPQSIHAEALRVYDTGKLHADTGFQAQVDNFEIVKNWEQKMRKR